MRTEEVKSVRRQLQERGLTAEVLTRWSAFPLARNLRELEDLFPAKKTKLVDNDLDANEPGEIVSTSRNLARPHSPPSLLHRQAGREISISPLFDEQSLTSELESDVSMIATKRSTLASPSDQNTKKKRNYY